MDMWHLMSGRKSTIKDKWIECNPKSHLEVDKWQEREDNSIDPILTQPVWGERKRKKERGKEGESFRKTESLPSLYIFRRSVRRIPARQEAKLIPTTWATCGYRYCGFSTTSRGRGVLILGYFLSKNQ